MKQRVLLTLFYVGALCALGLQPVQGQPVSQEQIQQHYHRAETAWKNRTSLLEAKVRVDRVLEGAPDHADALKLRAEVLMAMRRYDEAFQDARRAVALSPEDGAAHLILAEAARLSRDVETARDALEKAAMYNMEEGADFHLKLSRSAMLLGPEDWGKAESYARVALAKEPDNAAAYYQLARIFILRERQEAAATILEKGFRASLLDPSYIQNDSTLQRIQAHERIDSFMK